MEPFRNTAQPDWDWWGRLWPAPAETLRTIGLEAGRSLAEVACGNGYFAIPAARLTAPAPVYAIDLDDDVLAELARIADLQALSNVRTIQGDARDLPTLLPDPVDDVLVANVFHGVDDRRTFLERAAAALADGGRLVVVNWHDRPREETVVAGDPRGPPTELRLSPAETGEAVADAIDVRAVERHELPPYHYALVFEVA